jgi:hypothetical protein
VTRHQVNIGDRVGMKSTVDHNIHLGTVRWANEYTVAVYWDITGQVTRVPRSWVFHMVRHWQGEE